MKKLIFILFSFASLNTLANQNLDNQYYTSVQKMQDYPLSLNVKENDSKYIGLYSSVNNSMSSLNSTKNSKIYNQFKQQINFECNKLKNGSNENVSSAYCKASLNIAIYPKL